MSTAATGALDIAQLAGQAAEAVRALNHLTRPGIGALSSPAELDMVIADLACLTHRLPQLLAQLGSWLHAEEHTGRLRVDALALAPDSATAVAAAIEDLTRASSCAQHTGRALDAAHQTLAHLAVRDNGDQHGGGEREPR